VDGDTTTFVTSGAAQDGTFFAVFDLHGAVTVSSLTLDYGAGAKAGDSSASLKLQGSDDGVTFTDITGVISGTLVANKLTITVPTTTTHRFLKLLQVGTSGSWWAIPELGITCGAGTPAAPPADAGTASDRAQWKILTPNSLCAASGAITNMIDADTTTGWQSLGRPGVGYWIRVDLGTTAALKGVHLKNQGADFPASVKVQVSSDDINYVDAITGVTGALDMDMVFAATKNARFFRILSEVDNAAGHWWTVTDLNIDL
ncbi:MAG TPA: discoidin domain-containing protein, partial [Polyangiaceae bacterium]